MERKGGQPLGQGNHHLHLGHPQTSHWEGYVVQRDLGSDRAITPGSGTIAGSIQPSQEYQDHTLLENHFFEDPEKFDSWAGCEMVGQVEGGQEVLENKWNRIKRKTKKTKAAK